MGDHRDAAPRSAWPGRVISRQAGSILPAGGAAKCPPRGEGSPLSRLGTPTSFGAPHLQAYPEELPHPRRQVEGGNAAGHAQHTRGPSQGWGSQR